MFWGELFVFVNIHHISHCCNKILNQSNLKKEGFVLASRWRAQSIMAGMSSRQELRVSTVKNQGGVEVVLR